MGQSLRHYCYSGTLCDNCSCNCSSCEANRDKERHEKESIELTKALERRKQEDKKDFRNVLLEEVSPEELRNKGLLLAKELDCYSLEELIRGYDDGIVDMNRAQAKELRMIRYLLKLDE